jgi:hypothetical protein
MSGSLGEHVCFNNYRTLPIESGMNGLTRSVDNVPEYGSDGNPTGKSATAGGSRFLVKIGDPSEPAPNVIVTYGLLHPAHFAMTGNCGALMKLLWELLRLYEEFKGVFGYK